MPPYVDRFDTRRTSQDDRSPRDDPATTTENTSSHFFLHFLSRRASVSRANTFELRWTKWPHISKIFLQTDLLMNFFARVLDLETK